MHTSNDAGRRPCNSQGEPTIDVRSPDEAGGNSHHAPPSLSVDSSNSSFFSLANSTGFHTPLHDGSGHRRLFSSSNVAGGAGVGVAASRRSADVAAQLTSSEYKDRGDDDGDYFDVPLVYPKASRPRLGSTPLAAAAPPVARMPGSHTPSFSASTVPTGVTRGSQRHHLAFSDSPPPKDSPLPSCVWHAGLGRSVGDSSASSPKQRTPVTPGTNFSAHAAATTGKVDDTASIATGSHREGLFPTFGLPPPQTLDVGFPHSGVVSPTYAAGERNQRENGVSSSLPSSAADTLKRSSGAILDMKAPSLSTQASNAAHTGSRGKPLTSAHRYQEANDEEAEAVAAAVASAASSALHNKASPPPPIQRSTFTGHAPPQLALSTTAPHAVTDCTSRQPATAGVHKNQLTADQLALLRGGPFVRRASASAAPFVTPGWRPAGAGRAAVRRHGSTTGPTIIADGLAMEDRRETSSPPHLSQRPSSTPAVEGTGERRQSTPPPHYPAVRFIFTKSRSASKASSMDRSYEEASHSPEKKASPAPPVLSTALPPASLPASESCAIPSVSETATTKKEGNSTSSANSNGANRAKKTMASYVFSTLRRGTAPALTLDGLHRRHSTSVPFTRSATAATVSAMERHVDVMREAAAAATAANDGGDVGSDGEHNIRSSSGGICSSARKRAVARRGSAERSTTRDSRGSVEDFDAGPQSYLERWRQRQAEKKAANKELAVVVPVAKESMTQSHAENNAAQAGTVASKEAVAAVPANKENTPPASDVTASIPAPESTTTSTVLVTTGQEGSDAAAVAASTLHSESSAAKKENEASKSHGGYSLSDALRSCSIPDSSAAPDAAHSDGTKAAEQQRAESAVSVGVTATAESHIEMKTEVPAFQDTARLQEGVTQEEKAGSTAPAASSSSPALTQHSHTQQRQQQQPQQPPAEKRGANPAEASTRQKDTHSSDHTSASLVKTSRLSNSSYLTEDYARRASVDEDIPEEQLAATAATAPTKAPQKSSTTVSGTTTAMELLSSPSPPPQARKETNAVSAAATAVAVVVVTGGENESTRAAKGGTPLPASTRVSARPSALVSARGSSAVSPSGTEKADDGDRSSATAASSAGDVRDVRELCRAVLERREQRLQQQQEVQQQQKAAEQEDGKEGRQLQPSPARPPSLSASSRRARNAGNADDTKTDTHEDAAGTVDGATLKASRNSKLSSLSSPRRPSRSAPYTPPWKSGTAGGGSTAVSRPPSAVPDPALADSVLQLPASGRSTRTASRTLTPSAPATTLTATTSTTSAAAAVPPTIAAPLSRFSAVGTGATPQSEAASHATTPTPSVSNSASLRQERPALVVTPQEGGDAEAEAASREASAQRSSRISRLLARRRFSFPRQRAGAAQEEEEGEDEEEEESGGAALPNGSFRQFGRTQANASDPPSVEVATLGAAKGSSTVPSGRVSNRSLAAAPGGGGVGVEGGGGRHSSTRSRATPVTVSATQPVFDIAAAMESIPTVAEIEREAQRKEEQQQQQQKRLDSERRTNHTTEPEKAALVNKMKSPARRVTAEKEKPEAASGRSRQVSAAGSVVAAASSLLRSSPKAMDVHLQPMEAASSSSIPATAFSAGAVRSLPQLPPSPRSPDIVKPMTAASPTGTAAAATPSALLSANTRGPSATALADIQADELDRLEQSVNAMLMQYGKSAAHTSPAKESTPGAKPTAADRLLSQMPEHAKTRASVKLRQDTVTAAGTRAGQRISQKLGSREQSRQLPSSSSSSLLRPHACGSEVDDEDSHWNASLLWCGEETESLEVRPPPWVPALDLTSLQLPTNESEDLKPYRIPLPTAVAAPDENRRHLWQLAGVVWAASGSPEGDRNLGSERGSDRVTAAGSAASLSLHHTASSSLTEVSPFVGERIRRMKEQPAELSTSDVVAAAAAARKLRAARRGSRVAVHSALPAADGSSSVVVGKGGGPQRDGVSGTAPHSSHAIISSNRNNRKNSSSEEAEDDDEEDDEGEDSLYEVVDDAPQRVSRVVRFTDDSDALDGGRGAARDVRVGQQKNRVRLMLLDCEEQRERKAVLAEEQSAFVIIGKSYRRSSLLT